MPASPSASNQPSVATPPTRIQVGVVISSLVGVLILIWLGYDQPWTGFGSSVDSEAKKVPAKTLWDWLDLLIVPVILALGAWLLDGSRKASEAAVEARRKASEAAVEADRQRQKALDDYIEHMTQVLAEVPDPNTKHVVARMRMLVVLGVLDGGRKAQVLQLLYEAGLIGRPQPLVNLIGADFSHARLDRALLEKAQIRGAYFNNASFRSANLSQADLVGCDFRHSDFAGAKLDDTILKQALLENAVITRQQLDVADVEDASLPNPSQPGS